jgi:hypothetical protein
MLPFGVGSAALAELAAPDELRAFASVEAQLAALQGGAALRAR